MTGYKKFGCNDQFDIRIERMIPKSNLFEK